MAYRNDISIQMNIFEKKKMHTIMIDSIKITKLIQPMPENRNFVMDHAIAILQ